jgi:hypothetical protein
VGHALIERALYAVFGQKTRGSVTETTTLQQGLQCPADIDAVNVDQPSIETAARRPANGLRPSQLALLCALVDAGGAVPIAALVRRHPGASGVARSSVSRSLHRLHAQKFVDLLDKHRRPGAVHYARHVRVTAAGVEAVTSHFAVRVNTEVGS